VGLDPPLLVVVSPAWIVRGGRRATGRLIEACEHLFALIGSRPMLPPTADRLLTTSAAYVSAKFEFERAISDARRDGLPDEEIARLVGFSRPMIEAVAGKGR
jgi:hypothetical protein